MNHNMSTGFVHSVKVPRLFKESAKVLKKTVEEGGFKAVISNSKHPNFQGIYALVSETLQHYKELQSIIDKTQIFIENPRFDPWLARILITELLWGKKTLKSEAKPVTIILNYKEKLQQTLAQNSDAVVDPCDKKKVILPRYVRVNTLLTSVDEAIDAFYHEGWNLLPKSENYSSYLQTISNLENYDFIQDFHVPEILVFPAGTKFFEHPGYLNGKLLLQDKASCLSAFLLNPKPDSEILDMCAAPGMKTTHLAAIINNSGKIYAVEMNEKRHKTLCDFITHTGASCVEAIQADALTISPEQYPNVKYILVDPSCSGSGIVGRFEIRDQNQGDLRYRLRKLHSLQVMILNHALFNFPNVKKVIYSTCSIHPEENESVVDEILRRTKDDFTLVNLKKKLKNEWHNFASSEYYFKGEKCLYALPEKDFCNGFFLAMFKRKSKAADIEVNTAQESISEFSTLNTVKIENDEVFEALPKKKKKLKNISNESTKEITNGHQESIEINVKEETCDITSSSLKKSKKRKIDSNEENTQNCEIPPKKEKKKKKKKDKHDAETNGQ